MEITFRAPRFFSDTRFPNYSYRVFYSFIENYPAIVKVLAEIQEAGQKQGASQRVKDKADIAAGFQSRILNIKFLLQLALICDIYYHFGCSAKILQIVNILPHEKYDMFQSGFRDKLLEMKTSVDPVDCACSVFVLQPKEEVLVEGDLELDSEVEDEDLQTAQEVCSWPLLHKFIRQYKKDFHVCGVLVPNLEADPPRPGTRQGLQHMLMDRNQGEGGLLRKISENAKAVAAYLYKELEEVYNAEDRRMIKSIREVLDLKAILDQIQDVGAPATAALRTNAFLRAAQHIDPDMYKHCEFRTEWREQHQHFLETLQSINSEVKNSSSLSSMDILVLMLNTEAKRYQGCQLIMHIVTQAATIKSVESVVESWISRLEAHDRKERSLTEDSCQTELMIAVNGPLVQHCRGVVEEAMGAYWRQTRVGCYYILSQKLF